MALPCINRVTLVGTVGHAPELRTLSRDAKRVATFTVATSNGANQPVQWHRVVVTNDYLVGFVADKVGAGANVLLEGELQYRTYRDKAGAQRLIAEIEIGRFKATLLLLGTGGEPAQGAASTEDEP